MLPALCVIMRLYYSMADSQLRSEDAFTNSLLRKIYLSNEINVYFCVASYEMFKLSKVDSGDEKGSGKD